MPINKIVVHPITNCKLIWDLDAKLELDLPNNTIFRHHHEANSNEIKTYDTNLSFDKHKNTNLEGKLYTYDRLDGSYFTLWNHLDSTLYDENTTELHIRIAAHGPFLCFSINGSDK